MNPTIERSGAAMASWSSWAGPVGTRAASAAAEGLGEGGGFFAGEAARLGVAPARADDAEGGAGVVAPAEVCERLAQGELDVGVLERYFERHAGVGGALEIGEGGRGLAGEVVGGADEGVAEGEWGVVRNAEGGCVGEGALGVVAGFGDGGVAVEPDEWA